MEKQGDEALSIIERLKSDTLFSDAETKVRDYVKQYPDRIKMMTVRELAQETYTTPTTIMRFCKKLGYDGYRSFQINFLNDMKDLEVDNYLISGGESTVDVMNKVALLYTDAIETTSSHLALSDLEAVAKLIKQRKVINFLAYDANVSLANYGSQNFIMLNKQSYVLTGINDQLLYALNQSANKDQLSIIISRTASTRRIIRLAQALKDNGHTTILISENRKNLITDNVTYQLSVAYTGKFDKLGDLVFYTGTKYILDLLFMLCYKDQFKETNEFVKEYNQLLGTDWLFDMNWDSQTRI